MYQEIIDASKSACTGMIKIIDVFKFIAKNNAISALVKAKVSSGTAIIIIREGELGFLEGGKFTSIIRSFGCFVKNTSILMARLSKFSTSIQYIMNF
ncbi:MAG: hypothetical protein IPP01_00495 [Saprospiraceae bacterium]|nr:hypothetical protein [Saprospiraceae bacterium]